MGDGGGDLCTAIPATLTLISPALSLTHWQAYLPIHSYRRHYWQRWCRQPSGGRGVVDCLAGDCGAVAWAEWQRMCARLPWLLAIPHVAFAPAPFCSLLTEGCFMTISRIHSANGPIWHRSGPHPCSERNAFLLWILAAVLSEKRLLQQVLYWIRWATAAGNA